MNKILSAIVLTAAFAIIRFAYAPSFFVVKSVGVAMAVFGFFLCFMLGDFLEGWPADLGVSLIISGFAVLMLL
jgi:hypothetical protein